MKTSTFKCRLFTFLGSWTGPSLSCPFPSCFHQPFSAKQASPVQSYRKNKQIHEFHVCAFNFRVIRPTSILPTCLCLISSFFCSRKTEGMPAMFSWALSNKGHRSFMNSRAFLPFKKPVRLICIILASGCCNTHMEKGEKQHMSINRMETMMGRGSSLC